MKLASTASALGITLSATWLARAQPPEGPPAADRPAPITTTPPSAEAPAWTRVPAPRNALELSFSSGYTQGFGTMTTGVGMPSVATAGVGFDAGIGYRIDASWAVLWSGQYQELTPERSDAARGFTNAIAAQYHFAPTQRFDPWLEGGAGYRFLWEDPTVGPTLLTHGWQLVRVRAGLDFRADEHVALGPVVGADATMFLFQDVPRAATYLDDPQLSTFVFAGVQGRLDIGLGGGRSSAMARGPTRTITARREAAPCTQPAASGEPPAGRKAQRGSP